MPSSAGPDGAQFSQIHLGWNGPGLRRLSAHFFIGLEPEDVQGRHGTG